MFNRAPYQPRVRLQRLHTDSITGTSTRTPTTVAGSIHAANRCCMNTHASKAVLKAFVRATRLLSILGFAVPFC